MGLKEGLLLAALYEIPLVLLIPPNPSDPGIIFAWFLVLLIGGVLLFVTAIVAWKFFDIDFVPWGLIIWLGTPLLALLFSPIFSLVWAYYIVPPAVLFLIGLTQG